MKPITVLIILILIGMFLAFLMASGKTKQRHYLKKIIYLEAFMQTSRPTNENFNFIFSEFEEVWRVDCDTKRTKKLFDKFQKRYISQWLDNTIRDKSDPKFMNLHTKIMAK